MVYFKIFTVQQRLKQKTLQKFSKKLAQKKFSFYKIIRLIFCHTEKFECVIVFLQDENRTIRFTPVQNEGL